MLFDKYFKQKAVTSGEAIFASMGSCKVQGWFTSAKAKLYSILNTVKFKSSASPRL
jgi:hypothetical protein